MAEQAEDEYEKFRELFDPAFASVRNLGVVGTVAASEGQLAAARARLKERRARYAWFALGQHELSLLRDLIEAWREFRVQAAEPSQDFVPEDAHPSTDKAFAPPAAGSPKPDGAPSRPGEETLPPDGAGGTHKATSIGAVAREKAEQDRKIAAEEVKLANSLLAALADPDREQARHFRRALPFYQEGMLLHLAPRGGEDIQWRVVVVAPPGSSSESIIDATDLSRTSVAILDATSPPIHRLNEFLDAEGRLRLTLETVEEYLDFFCTHVHGRDGPFGLIEFDQRPPDDAAGLIPAARDIQPKDRRVQVAQPITRIDRGSNLQDELAQLIATVIYGGTCFRALFSVMRTGMIQMIDDDPLPGVALDYDPEAWQGLKGKSDATAEQNTTLGAAEEGAA